MDAVLRARCARGGLLVMSELQWALRERDEAREALAATEQVLTDTEAERDHYQRACSRARAAWQVVADAQNGLRSLLAYLDSTDEAIDAVIDTEPS